MKLPIRIGLVSFLLLGLGVGAYADTTLKEIDGAYQNAALQLYVDGKSIDLSSEDGIMYPIVYGGHSYVSARALAEALGADVQWDEENKRVIIITKKSSDDRVVNIDPNPDQDRSVTSDDIKSVYPGNYDTDQLITDYKAAAQRLLISFSLTLQTGNGEDIKNTMSRYIDQGFAPTALSKSAGRSLKLSDSLRSSMPKESLDEFLGALNSAVSTGSTSLDAGSVKKEGKQLNFQYIIGQDSKQSPVSVSITYIKGDDNLLHCTDISFATMMGNN
ncbi:MULTISPECIES: copper amine oxidase N-terminal domain-containing protein [unclassified Paenibacillus]|uniref:copper amine oxidase N-terminal domain-containing protein n=1 Tax=unclassified Paenibacillus TaxID=185978 RepID=UPI002780125B|nr:MULTISPECIES: copper amine oxidase N-terminal domain-containing protein [unclassified Paenibacillus]MDQ0896378.1 hypothetical protein [Paenibacillus sp. V4I7]MDQ0914078.1 hypothetical protein [Paenibacillus sp. V4I5]